MSEPEPARRPSAGSEVRLPPMLHEHCAAMLLIDPDTGDIVDANPAASHFYGYEIAGLRSMVITQIIMLDPREVAERLAEASSGGRGDFLSSHRLASGEVRTVDVRSSAMQERGRRPLLAIIHDETQWTRVAPELAEAERRYRMIAENTDGAVLLVSPQGAVTWASPSFEHILGYTAGEVMGLDGASLVHPDDLAAARARVTRSWPDSEAPATEMRFRRKDGQYRWMAASTRVMTDPQGRFVGRLVTLRDVHEQVLARQALAESEERLHLVLEASRLGLWDWNMQTNVGVVDEAWAQMLGYRRADLDPITSDTWNSLTHPDDLTAGNAMAASHAKGLIPVYDVELRMRHRDGHWVWIRDRGRIVEWAADGRPLRMAGTAEDVTERMEAKHSLEREQRTLELAMDGAALGMAVVALDGRFLRANAALCQMVGRQWEWFSEHTESDISLPAGAGDHTAIHERLLRGEAASDVHDGWVLTADGTLLNVVHSVGLARDEQGTPLFYVSQYQDVTQERANAERLATAEEQFRLAMDNSAIGMCLVSREGRFLRVNPALCAMLDRSAEELQATTWQVLTHPDDLEADLALVAGVLDGSRSTYRLLKRFIATNGRVVWGDLSVAAVRNDDGTARYLVSQIVDVTARIDIEHALAESEDLLRDVLDSSHDIIIRIDRDIRTEYVNQRITEVTGLAVADVVGKTPREAGFPDDLAERWSEHGLAVFETGESLVYEFEIDTVEGRRWYEGRLVPEFAPDGSVAHVIATNRDVTDRKRDEEAMRHLATHDSLTGLANRASMLDEVRRALSSGQRSGRATAVLVIDLDHFKDANDTLGHAAGDEVLQSVAARIGASVRGGDLVARPGGDEFVIVMRDLDDPTEAVRLAERLVTEFRSPFTARGSEVYSTASIGVAVAIDSCAAEADQLLLEADTALYAAKGEGRDRVMVFNERLRTAVTSRLAIESELRHALRRGELAVWYQPEVHLTTGAVTAVEALLRWHHPDGDLYTADRFVEVAEESRLILEIGDWVLREACAQAARWVRERPDTLLTVRVNVSALQLAEDTLLDGVDEALAASALDPGRLCLEITETAMLRDTATVHANLAGIRDRGIRVAVDDFGTAYASLAYLRRHHVDVLKIDRSFVADVTTNERGRRLVAGIVTLAEALGMSVTAEGVENEEQAAALRLLGCPSAQGFHYSSAVPPEQVESLLDTVLPRTRTARSDA